MDSNLESRIRSRAYQLWQNDPSPDGKADLHWEMARRQVEAEGDPAQEDASPNVDQSAEREKLQDLSSPSSPPARTGKHQRA
jgi:Protein of unknown function (DUF2934)